MADKADGTSGVIGEAFIRTRGQGSGVRQSISLSNFVDPICGPNQLRAWPIAPERLLSAEHEEHMTEQKCRATGGDTSAHQKTKPTFDSRSSASTRGCYTLPSDRQLATVRTHASSAPLRSHAVLSEPPSSRHAEIIYPASPSSVTPQTQYTRSVSSTSALGQIGDALSSFAQTATPPGPGRTSSSTNTIWAWLTGESASQTDFLPPVGGSQTPTCLVRSASEALNRSSALIFHEPGGSSLGIPVAQCHSPPPGYHQLSSPQALSDYHGTEPAIPSASPRPALVSLRRQSSVTPRSQPIEFDDASQSPLTGEGHVEGRAMWQSADLACHVRISQELPPRPQSAPTGSPLASPPASPSSAWMPWLSGPQVTHGSVETTSMLSEPATAPAAGLGAATRQRQRTINPLDSFPLHLEDLKEYDMQVEEAGAGHAQDGVSSSKAETGALFRALFSAVLGPQTLAPAEAGSPQGDGWIASDDGMVTFPMPEGVREGFGSTPGVVQKIPNNMMHEIAAMFDEPWAVATVGYGSSDALGVGEGSILGPSAVAAAGHQVERVLNHDDRSLNVSFVLDRHPLRGGLFAYRSRLKIYGSCPNNACTFMLRDDVIRSGNPSILSYERLKGLSTDCGGAEGLHSDAADHAESGIVHSRLKMPAFISTRQYIACRRVWRWVETPQCVIASIPYNNSDGIKLSEENGSVAQDYRMGYIVRPFTDANGSGTEVCTVCYEDFGILPCLANGFAQGTLWSTSKSFVSHFRKFEEAVAMAGSSGDIMTAFREVQVHEGACAKRLGFRLPMYLLAAFVSGMLSARFF